MTNFIPRNPSTLSGERSALARETDPELRAEGLLNLAGRQAARGHSELAAELYASLLDEATLPDSVRQRAAERLGALRGSGPVGARAEVLLRRFAEEATEPTTLFAMGAAGAAFKTTRFLALSRLGTSPQASFLTRGFGARALAGVSALGVEAAVFPLAGRTASLALGRELEWSAGALGHELASSALVLGSLRGGGWLFGQAARLSGAAAWRGALAQTGMLGGILLSRRLEEGLGLRDRLPGATVLTDSLAMLLQFNVAGRFSRAAFGEGFARWERRVEAQTQVLGRPLSNPPRPPLFQRGESVEPVFYPLFSKGGRGGISPAFAGPPGFHVPALGPQVLMAQSHDSGKPGTGSNPPRPLAASERPLSPPEKPGAAETAPARTEPLRATPLAELSTEGVRQNGEAWELNFRVSGLEALAYGQVSGQRMFNRHALIPTGMTFAKAFPAIVAAAGEAIRRAPSPTVIHALEEIQYHEPIRLDQEMRLRVTRRIRGSEGKPQNVFLTREIFRASDPDSAPPLAVAKTVLVVGPELAGVKVQGLSEAEFAALSEPVFQVEVTPELIDAFCRASGDFNPVHVSDAAAQELGLPGRILHGMATFNFAERALRQVSGSDLPRGYTLKASFQGMARPGDRLSFHVSGQGERVTVLNERRERVLTLDAKPLSAVSPRTVEVPETVSAVFGRSKIEVQSRAGWETIQRIRANVAPWLPRLREVLAARPEQPWFIAGTSDGMGLYSSVALMEAGVRHMVGVFYEPEALLRKKSDIHLGRLANAEGLRLLAEERGTHFAQFYEDLVLPQTGAPARPFPEAVRDAIRDAQRRSWNQNLQFVNSIAFARWMSPSPGVEQLKGIPSLDREGRVFLADMKAYHPEHYEGTLNSMGRNHGVLLEQLTPHFGPDSTSFFFTWAGGSQNTRILRGVYGGGSLGHAKEIGETAALRYHLQSQDTGFELGHHKVVRFPDFPSYALFGIPGGGAFGMIARRVLENHGVYTDIGELAPRAYIEAFGGEHNLRNPMAQIELDVPESYHLQEIGANLREFHQRVAAYRAAHPEWTGQALDSKTSGELLQGLVSPDYVAQIPKATE